MLINHRTKVACQSALIIWPMQSVAATESAIQDIFAHLYIAISDAGKAMDVIFDVKLTGDVRSQIRVRR